MGNFILYFLRVIDGILKQHQCLLEKQGSIFKYDLSSAINFIIKQILTNMISTTRQTSLLGSYKEKQYSQGFQKLMSNVVSKIYRSKANKQTVFKTLAPLACREPQSRRRSTKISFSQQPNRRKNSEPIASFYMNFPKPNGLSLQNQRNKYSLINFKLPQEVSKRSSKTTKRCQSLSHSQYQESLYQKINDYNTCLITKTYRFQEKEKLSVCFDERNEGNRNQDSPTFMSKIRKCQNFRRNNKWINSKGKFIKESIKLNKIKDDFKPWQFDQADELEY